MVSMLISLLKEAIGFHYFSYTVLWHMLVRGVIVSFVGILIARLNKKLMSVRTPFNFILFVMFGSVFAACIMDEKLFLPIIITILFLIALNGLVTALAFYSPFIENLIKGTTPVLVKNGTIKWDAMRTYFITERELMNELHTQLHTQDLSRVKLAHLASDGTINFIES